jgi:hypothetical protein
MHAVEVARHAFVRDQDSMRALYERIGKRELDSTRFDTNAAVDVGRRVRLDLLRASSPPPWLPQTRYTGVSIAVAGSPE